MVISKKDLGSLFSSDFYSHIKAIYCRTFKILSFVIRISRKFKLSGSLKTLYWSLICLVFQYTVVFWDPSTAGKFSLIEQVQRRFILLATYILKITHFQHNYRPVMRKLGLIALADKRVDANLIFLRNLVNNCVIVPSLFSLINCHVPFKFYKILFDFCRTSVVDFYV